MRAQVYIEECGDDLTAHAIRCCVTAEAIGQEVIFKRTGIELVCYPQTHYIDLCRLFAAMLEYRKWRIGK